jgi:hypothetical protein
MGVSLCIVCPVCKSTLATGPESHQEPHPHEFKTKYNENTGEPYEICWNCLRTKKELEEKNEEKKLTFLLFVFCLCLRYFV